MESFAGNRGNVLQDEQAKAVVLHDLVVMVRVEYKVCGVRLSVDLICAEANRSDAVEQ